MSLQVRQATAADAARWNAFVLDHAAATFCHRFEWAPVLEQAFGHRPRPLLAEQDGEVVGILPLAEVKSRLFGHSLSSLPFCVYGGVVATNAQADHALRQAACDLAEQLQVDALELRSTRAGNSGWPSKDLYYTFRRELSRDHDSNLKAIPNRQRAMIRKGIGAGLSSEQTTSTKRLYRVYAESVRNLGTPVFARRYLDVLRQTFGDDCRMLMIREGGEDVAGVLSFYHRGEVLPYYGGSVARARDIKGCNHFMYWELMRRSVDEGVLGFDFGRSKIDTGPFSFKKNWGFEPQPLPYEYHLVRAAAMPNLSPANPRYRLLINTWRRLPLPIANRIGPLVAGSLG
ncbi:FemAB family XrtA/PEP-CTERM system-associated protein [Parahaliea mediterranea]|uniref:FemAB family XrtA/PEP-CTERM system-associated protein n=1 Tax=Parahaliea mediterranea TaxID=651086 RepID=UPI000E2F98BA|nr:FemAB family XrtA/PEP-CTERM system-associated protein [Parahaliea mediterranea]